LLSVLALCTHSTNVQVL